MPLLTKSLRLRVADDSKLAVYLDRNGNEMKVSLDGLGLYDIDITITGKHAFDQIDDSDYNSGKLTVYVVNATKTRLFLHWQRLTINETISALAKTDDRSWFSHTIYLRRHNFENRKSGRGRDWGRSNDPMT